MRQALVLVGGRGTRLGAIAEATPKPLLPIDGERLFVDYVLANLARQGVREIILLSGHRGEQVEARYQGARAGEAAVHVVREPEPAGTAGALLHAADRLDPEFLMLNGDTLFDFDAASLGNSLRAGDVGALALRPIDDGGRYGNVEFVDGRIAAFREKDPARQGPALISLGAYALRRDVLKRIAKTPCSIENDVFPVLAGEGLLGGAVFEGYFIDIGLPDTLAQARRELPALFGHLF